MNSVEVSSVSKSFDGRAVVSDLSFEVRAGEIFGLLGPNGAGKTTMIRMLLDIIRPDSGRITVLNRSSGEVKDFIGYLPEERGLYRKLTVMDTLMYLGSLKNNQSEERTLALLEKMGLLSHRDKKVSELSKGMQQKIQIIAAIIHDPDLVILDEPFTGLDPVNMKLVQDLILELKNKGKTILISTHMMDKVERMCDRIFMIHRGSGVLYGSISEIKSRYGKNTIFIEFEGKLKSIPGVKKINNAGNYAELTLDSGTDSQSVLKSIVGEVRVNKFEISAPPLNEIFIDVVEKT
ncbi:MAG: Vitamin B12 import ATP-binding protein BtuD [Candidatus Argoarchaeum ethanivorans]|uniref:Vitamin B12 import ATP-binding protein BtuD n=1 Tax=Candidatus Argoarchaeum ethanivorans TaxID=2608793 RepID=A0A811T1G5_9EURY|nr:MAG: Vitamin B12 import ATP-binding protein BtuD [Candidatus Argoarchaeum ethanivorans]